MKKTLIAAGIAAVIAAPAAFAEVTISGTIEQNFVKSDSATAAVDGDLRGNMDNSITFSASEDLGNGLTAFASITLDTDDSATADNDGGVSTKDQKAGIKGSFGTVVVGRMESLSEGKVSGMLDQFEISSIEDTGDYAGRANDGIAYVSPTMNGFHFAVAGFAVDNDATAGALNNDTFDATDLYAEYANGPLTLRVGYEDHKRTAGATTQSNDILTVGASYTMGDATLTAVHKSTDYATYKDTDDLGVILSYNMGANNIKLGWNDYETSGASAVTSDNDVSIELTHNFSKKTKVYVGMQNAGAANSDKVGFGMKTKF